MSMNVSLLFSQLSLKAGAKVQYLFNLARLITLFFKSLSLLIIGVS